MQINALKGKTNIYFKQDSIENESQNLKNPEVKTDNIEIKTKVKPPQISTMRLFFHALSDEQINQVNKSKMLPENGKFVRDGYGGYIVSANLMNLRIGTRKLPEGFEVRKNALGLTLILPIDSEGLLIKKKQEN